MGGGLTIGLTCLVGASFASMFFPGSSLLQNITIYGGLGLFGAMQLYDTQKVAQKARLASDEHSRSLLALCRLPGYVSEC